MLLKIGNGNNFTIALQKADLSPNIVFSIRKQFPKLFAPKFCYCLGTYEVEQTVVSS